MNPPDLLLPAIGAFVTMIIGLVLTVLEFRRMQRNRKDGD